MFKEFSNLNYKNFFCDVVGWEDLKTTLVRLHTNLNFFKYQGEWHRDNLSYPSPEKFQSVIYLKKEKGFKIVPRSKNQLLEKYDIPVDKPPKKGQGFFKLDKNIYHEIEAERGDLLIFEAGLLHQGYVKGSRLHYHIRHEKIAKKNLNLNNPFNFIEKYLPDYDLKNEYYEPRYFQSNLNLIFMRIRTLFLFYTENKRNFLNLVNKKNKKTISHSTIWQ